MERWLPGSAGQLVDAATDAWRLMQLPPPSRTELEHLQSVGGGDGGGGGPLTTVWATKLAKLARGVTSGISAGAWEAGGGSDGAALARWMEKVVGQLNTYTLGASGSLTGGGAEN